MPLIYSVQNVIRTTLMLMGIWGLVVFAATAQAACHEEHNGLSGQDQMVSTAQAGPSHLMHRAVPTAMVDQASNQADSADHDCCSPGCHCPSALCGGGHGVPLTNIFTLPVFGATEQIQ